jgi:hypothetical protein
MRLIRKPPGEPNARRLPLRSRSPFVSSSANPRETKQGLARFCQMLVDIRDGVQKEVARGATEEQAVAAVKWSQYQGLQGYNAQHDVAVRRLFEQLTGALK